MNRRRGRGFTLVEMLVVITIIGMLMALLMPAVQSARESARRATCSNNQKQLSLALQGYESSYRYFPGYVNYYGPIGDSSSKAGAYGKMLVSSWVVALFPYLDRNDLWEVWRQGTNYKSLDDSTPPSGLTKEERDRNKYLPLLVCPSNPAAQRGPNDTPIAYVVNCGLPDIVENANTGALDMSGLQPSPQAYGIFFKKGLTTSNQPIGASVRVSMDYISQHDGTTTTLMLSENVNAGRWAVEAGSSDKQTDRELGFCWHSDAGSHMNKINSNLLQTGQNPEPRRPSSRHSGGVMVSFCDGHQYFLREEIDHKVYWHLMTPYGRGAIIDGRSGLDDLKNGVPGILSEGDY